MLASVNRVVLLGQLGKFGMEMRYSTSGAPCASFVLVLSEVGADGKAHETYVPCECWGKKAESVASEMEAGQQVLFEGRLRKRPKGDNQWELIVSGFDLTPLLVPSLAAGHN